MVESDELVFPGALFLAILSVAMCPWLGIIYALAMIIYGLSLQQSTEEAVREIEKHLDIERRAFDSHDLGPVYLKPNSSSFSRTCSNCGAQVCVGMKNGTWFENSMGKRLKNAPFCSFRNRDVTA